MRVSGTYSLEPPGVFEQHIVALSVALRDLTQSQILGYAVLGVDHKVARFEIDQVGRESGQPRLGGGVAHHQFGGFEKVLRAKYYNIRVYKKQCRGAPGLDHGMLARTRPYMPARRGMPGVESTCSRPNW